MDIGSCPPESLPGSSKTNPREQSESFDEPLIRKFKTGATRDVDNEKPDFDGFFSSSALRRFSETVEKERDFAWAAGLFEGEGCITIMKTKGRVKKDGTGGERIYRYPRLTMSLTDEDVLRRFGAIAGGTIRGPYHKNPKYKPIWYWQVGGEAAKKTAEFLLPYLGTRRAARLFEVFGAERVASMAGFPTNVLRSFGSYMHKNRLQKDGSIRSSDNWKKGIPFDAYMKSGYRHFVDWWEAHQKQSDPEEALCALLFNVQGYLHELLKAKSNDP